MQEITETILSRLKYFAENTPNKICLIEAASDRKISYGEFWSNILKYAAQVQADKLYILQTRQTINHFIAFYGVQAAGSIAIPVESTSTAERLAEFSRQFNAEILPVEFNLSDTEIKFTPPNPAQISCIICTTGTTGKSKGVLSSFRCRFCDADNVRYAYEITADDIALVPQMFSHSGGLRRVEAMLISGATAVIMGATMFFGNVFNAIKKYSCNILQFVPAQVAQILQRAERFLIDVAPQLKILSVGSAAISENDKEHLRKILPNVRLVNDFGSTEAIGSAYFEWSAFPPKPNCIGTAGIHSKIVFVDDNGNLLTNTSYNSPGILATEGETRMSGYFNDAKLTNEIMRNNRVISADLGYLGNDGLIYLIGRKDDIIISGANKISPVEIENAVAQLSNVKECACVPRQDKIMGQMPALFIVLKNPLPLEKLINLLSDKLDRFKIPRAEDIHIVDNLPRTLGTGKIIKRQLIERLNDENL